MSNPSGADAVGHWRLGHGQDRGDPAREQDGGGQSVDRVERHHDGLAQVAAAGCAAEIQRVLVDMDEDPRAGRRGGEQKREQRKREQQEIYAKLAATMSFLVNRYGEHKVESLFVQFQDGASLEQVFESTFGEKISVIEQEWVKAISPQSK